MHKTSRREFLKHSSVGVAGLSILPSKLMGASGAPSTRGTVSIPPHQPMQVAGVHGYAEQSIAAGETIHFRINSTVPHRLSIHRLGLDPESPGQDVLVHEFPESPALPQPIHPGSYVHVEKNLQGALKALTIECWVRRWKLKDYAGIVTQYDSAGAKEFGLFAGPAGALSFCIGDKAGIDDVKQQLSGKAGLIGERWHHVVAVWDGRHRIVFVNGKQVAKWPCKTTLTAGKVPLRLAAAGKAGVASGFLDADLAMPVIYRRALAADEVAARFRQKALVPAQGREVAACWRLDEPQGERVADASGNGRHGRIINHATRMIPGPSFDFEVIRFASYEPRKDKLRGHALRFASDDLYDCRWNQTNQFTVPANARSGFYVGRIAYQWAGKPHLYHIMFIVRKRARQKKAPLLLLAATNTWRAYSSATFSKPQALLKRNVGTGGTENSPGDPPAYSFYRRHAAGQGGYQIGLRMPFVGADPYLLYGEQYSHLARAERFTQVWLEQSGYDYDMITDLDLHRDPGILDGYQAVIINGHNEYWSVAEYRGLEKYLQRGGNAVVLSGNSMLWRVTFDEDASIIECRKVDAPGEQMKPHERAECWHAHDGLRGGFLRECGPPSYKLIGLDMLGFAGENAFGPYVVEQAGHFLFHQPEETGLKAGDEFGQGPNGTMPRANGHEVDIRMSTFAALQEQPTPAGASVPADPPGMTRIANGITRWDVSGTAFDYFFRVIKPKTPQGAEMIYWERADGGKVFNAGAIASGWAIHSDPKFQTLMRNVFAHFGVPKPRENSDDGEFHRQARPMPRMMDQYTARFMKSPITRRTMLRRTAGACAIGLFFPRIASAVMRPENSFGYVVGEPDVEDIGNRILADGGNAFDAIAATALAGAVAHPQQTGVGGYGAHGVFASAGDRRILALDANSAAPAAMREDVFKPGKNGEVPGLINQWGWLSAGVPGVIGGIHLMVERLGSRPFSEALRPAIGLARDGIRLSAGVAAAIQGSKAHFEKDAASRKLYFPDGKPPVAGETFRNPELAELLETLAKANSTEPFYRGDIAQRIAEGFQKNGGLLTAKDLAAYRPRLVEPLALTLGDHTIHTSPLTAGGLTVLQILKTLQAMGWEKMPAGLASTHAQIEAMRLAWRDRLALLGDPDFATVPQARLLSEDYARECAEKIRATVKSGKLLAHAVRPQDHGGTLSFSALDKHGNFAALTLTHGSGFGARVTVDGLGLTLGHGMSRFDPHPGHPNAPGPGKRPLNNMVPTIITRGGRPIIAVGGRGGRMIPNTMIQFLTQSVMLGRSLDASMNAPRIHTEGDAIVEFEKAWPEIELTALKNIGYRVQTRGAAMLSTVAVEDGVMRAAMR